MDKGAVFVATCVAAAVSTLIMALYANYPIALAPGMGLNAFFAFTLVLAYKYTWQQALAAVFVLRRVWRSSSRSRRCANTSSTRSRRNLKLAMSAGVGLFLVIIALEQAKIVVAHPATLVTLGDLKQWPAILCAARLRADRGAQLPQGARRDADRHPGRHADRHSARARRNIPASSRCRRRSRRPSCSSISRACSKRPLIVVIFTLLLVDFFDNAGTLIGVTHRGRLARQGRQAAAHAAGAGRRQLRPPMIRLAARHLEHHELYRERGRRRGRRPHRLDRRRGRGAVPAGAVLLAARRHDPGLCVGRGAALCRSA